MVSVHTSASCARSRRCKFFPDPRYRLQSLRRTGLSFFPVHKKIICKICMNASGAPDNRVTKVKSLELVFWPNLGGVSSPYEQHGRSDAMANHGIQTKKQRSNGFLRCSPACTLPQVLRQIKLLQLWPRRAAAGRVRYHRDRLCKLVVFVDQASRSHQWAGSRTTGHSARPKCS